MNAQIIIPETGEVLSVSPGIGIPGNFTATSYSPPDALSFDDWSAIGAQLHALEKGSRWWIGDWWAFGSHRYGERAAAAAEGLFGLSFQTLSHSGSTARAFETCRRRQVLPF